MNRKYKANLHLRLHESFNDVTLQRHSHFFLDKEMHNTSILKYIPELNKNKNTPVVFNKNFYIDPIDDVECIIFDYYFNNMRFSINVSECSVFLSKKISDGKFIFKLNSDFTLLKNKFAINNEFDIEKLMILNSNCVFEQKYFSIKFKKVFYKNDIFDILDDVYNISKIHFNTYLYAARCDGSVFTNSLVDVLNKKFGKNFSTIPFP